MGKLKLTMKESSKLVLAVGMLLLGFLVTLQLWGAFSFTNALISGTVIILLSLIAFLETGSTLLKGNVTKTTTPTVILAVLAGFGLVFGFTGIFGITLPPAIMGAEGFVVLMLVFVATIEMFR